MALSTNKSIKKNILADYNIIVNYQYIKYVISFLTQLEINEFFYLLLK